MLRMLLYTDMLNTMASMFRAISEIFRNCILVLHQNSSNNVFMKLESVIHIVVLKSCIQTQYIIKIYQLYTPVLKNDFKEILSLFSIIKSMYFYKCT